MNQPTIHIKTTPERKASAAAVAAERGQSLTDFLNEAIDHAIDEAATEKFARWAARQDPDAMLDSWERRRAVIKDDNR